MNTAISDKITAVLKSIETKYVDKGKSAASAKILALNDVVEFILKYGETPSIRNAIEMEAVGVHDLLSGILEGESAISILEKFTFTIHGIEGEGKEKYLMISIGDKTYGYKLKASASKQFGGLEGFRSYLFGKLREGGYGIAMKEVNTLVRSGDLIIGFKNKEALSMKDKATIKMKKSIKESTDISDMVEPDDDVVFVAASRGGKSRFIVARQKKGYILKTEKSVDYANTEREAMEKAAAEIFGKPLYGGTPYFIEKDDLDVNEILFRIPSMLKYIQGFTSKTEREASSFLFKLMTTGKLDKIMTATFGKNVGLLT